MLDGDPQPQPPAIRSNGYKQITKRELYPIRRYILMGAARPRPKRLAIKLREIRNALGLSQSQLHRQLRVESDIPYTRISDYELDKNEPTLMVLLEYARVAGVHLEEIVDDRVDLPTALPGPVKYGKVKPKARPKN